ncbi:unnamed protein product [Prorocentrum cordatum]|uniref:Uncharacterized protein n=1 Tax=Prorocentrum cordatum TaxID=2364126 RepID=A0ABN9WV52_9DINO|nr:unnamed protein product [Polarella glacialis]
MAADQALGAVRQIQALADGPQTPEMHAHLSQIVTPVLAFLDHPDARVRLNSARALLKLSAGYPEDMAAMDLSRARGALKRTRASRAAGTADADAQELEAILMDVLEAIATPGASAASTAASTPPSGGRGEVILKLGEHADGKVKAAILERVVAIPGVVSVTFEGDLVIASTRSAAVAADAGFLADVLVAIRAQGIEGVSLVSAGGPGAGAGTAAPAGPSGGRGRDAPEPPAAAPESEEDPDEGEPGYLDDDEEDEVVMSGSGAIGVPFGAPAGPGPLAVGQQWSFFSQSNWMTGRKVQEFDDDPALAARLAKAKRREEAKKEESRSRLGFVTSWLGMGQ